MKTTEQTVFLTELKPGPFQNRRYFDSEKLRELAESIKQDGLITAPLVTKNGRGFHILAGERRWRASSALAIVARGISATLNEAVFLVADVDGPATIAGLPGLADWPIRVRVAQGDECDLHVAAVVDNHQRANLNPIEEAMDFQSLMKKHGWSITKIARRVGKSYPYVHGRLEWLKVNEDIQAFVARGELSKDPRIVAALLLIPDEEARLKLVQRFVARKSSTRTIETACRRVTELMAQREAQDTVSVKQAQISAPPAAVVNRPERPEVCFCPDCRDLVQNLAEEFCGTCMVNGLSEACLTCPGVIEFVSQLVRVTQC